MPPREIIMSANPKQEGNGTDQKLRIEKREIYTHLWVTTINQVAHNNKTSQLIVADQE